MVLNNLQWFDQRQVKPLKLQRNAIKRESRSNGFSPFSSPALMANALRSRGVNPSTWSFMIIDTKGVATKTQARSSFHKSFSRRADSSRSQSVIFRKHRATVSRHSFRSCFKPRDMKKILQQLLKKLRRIRHQ